MLHPERTQPGQSQSRLVEARTAFKRVPSLFYVPFSWSPEEKAHWSTMRPVERLAALTSRYGMVPDHMSVLPLDFEFFPPQEPSVSQRGLRPIAGTPRMDSLV